MIGEPLLARHAASGDESLTDNRAARRHGRFRERFTIHPRP